MKPHKYLICISGPTAVGKTAAAIELALHYRTEIISSDSRQFYKEMSIGTAKPSEEELQMVPHHFVGHIPVTQTYSAGDFERDVLKKLDELFVSHDVVIMVGGSGLYSKAVYEGLHTLPGADEDLRAELNQLYRDEGLEALQNRLRQTDEAAYEMAEIQNPQRVMRAIEISLAKQKGFDMDATPPDPRNFNTIHLVLNLPRAILYDRINKRVDAMMQKGLIDEVKSLTAYRNEYALRTVGYKEIFDYLDGKLTLEKAVDLIKQHTRNFAKRQLTWFKKEEPDHWFEPQNLDGMRTLIDSAITR